MLNRVAYISMMVLFFSFSANTQASTLHFVETRGFIQCGIGENPGFAEKDAEGKWQGFEIDLCRAFAAGIFGNLNKVEFTSLTNQNRFSILQSGDIDVLLNHSTWTFTRDTLLKMDFTSTILHDGQGFLSLAKKYNKNESVEKRLRKQKICATKNTNSINNINDFIETKGIKAEVIESINAKDMSEKFINKECDVITNDLFQLYIAAKDLPTNNKYVVWDQTISKELISPAVRHDDSQWKDLLQWILFSLIEAEELGVNSTNVDKMRDSIHMPTKFLLSNNGTLGANLGLQDDFVYQVIKQVGNYGEIFERNLGRDSKYKIQRRLNKPYTQGGLLYSPLFK